MWLCPNYIIYYFNKTYFLQIFGSDKLDNHVVVNHDLEVEQGRGILCVHPVQPKACRTWFKLYYFNPTMASINDTYIVLATIPSLAGLTHIPQ